MTQRNPAELASQISTLLADNTTGAISAADLRSIATDLADSLAFVAVLATVATSGAYGDLTGAPTIPSTAGDVGAATAAQGALADSATQPGDLAAVATSGAYSALTGAPTIPSTPAEVGAATAAQGALADTAVQGSGIDTVQAITQAAFDALTTPNPTTLYVITG